MGGRKQDRKEVSSPSPYDVLGLCRLEVIVEHEQTKLWELSRGLRKGEF